MEINQFKISRTSAELYGKDTIDDRIRNFQVLKEDRSCHMMAGQLDH